MEWFREGNNSVRRIVDSPYIEASFSYPPVPVKDTTQGESTSETQHVGQLSSSAERPPSRKFLETMRIQSDGSQFPFLSPDYKCTYLSIEDLIDINLKRQRG
jgi:hypothetical protein